MGNTIMNTHVQANSVGDTVGSVCTDGMKIEEKQREIFKVEAVVVVRQQKTNDTFREQTATTLKPSKKISAHRMASHSDELEPKHKEVSIDVGLLS